MLNSQPNRKRRSGSTVTELAVTLPVFVLILIGSIETAAMIFLQQSLEICAYQGARVALIPSSKSTTVGKACNKILTDRNIRSASISVSPENHETQPYGALIRVRVSAPCNSNSPFSPWFYGGRTLTGEVTMMKEY